jgi:hypothetical protein
MVDETDVGETWTAGLAGRAPTRIPIFRRNYGTSVQKIGSIPPIMRGEALESADKRAKAARILFECRSFLV